MNAAATLWAGGAGGALGLVKTLKPLPSWRWVVTDGLNVRLWLVVPFSWFVCFRLLVRLRPSLGGGALAGCHLG